MFVVTGLGLIGLITVQLLRAQGCRVLGLDYERKRLALALDLKVDSTGRLEQLAVLQPPADEPIGAGSQGAVPASSQPRREVRLSDQDKAESEDILEVQ